MTPTRLLTLAGALAMASFAAAPSHAACSSADLNGSAMPSGTSAGRTMMVTPTTESVKVNYGETVKLVMQDGQEVTWKFDGLADKLTLRTLTASPSASQGASAERSAKITDIPIYVDQSRSPSRIMHPVCLGF